MAMIIMYMDFSYSGPWGEERLPSTASRAQDIAAEPGLIWKIWTENPETNEAGGVYLFSNVEDLERYLIKHTARLAKIGITNINVKRFYVADELSMITRAPLG